MIRRMKWLVFNAVRELGRTPGLRPLLGLAVLACGGGWWWRDFNFGATEARFLADFGFAMQGLAMTLFIAVGLPQAVQRELRQQTLPLLLVRRVRRGEFLLAQGLGFMVVALAFAVAATLVIAGVVAAATNGGGAELPAVWSRGIGQFLKALVVGGGVLLFTSYARSAVFATLASLSWVLAGHLRFLIGEEGGVASSLVRIVPDLRWFERGENAVTSTWLLVYAAAYAFAYATAAVFCFQRREV